MSLAIPNNKQEIQHKKSLVGELTKLQESGEIDATDLEHFIEKLNEAGELTLMMSNVNEREKNVKAELRKSEEYQAKIKVAQMKKYVKARQEKNLDETNGALELIIKRLGSGKARELKKLLTN